MDETLKGLMQELGNAINESLSDSDRIAAAIGEIKKAGYDVFLVLEATIGLNELELDEAEVEEVEEEFDGPFTPTDVTFLKSLRISVSEDDEEATDSTEPEA